VVILVVVEGVVGVDLDAFVMRIHHEVDHAGDCVGTVDGGGTAGQYVNALDQLGRDLVEVRRVGRAARTGDTAGAARLHAPAVDEHQGALRAEIAQADRDRKSTRLNSSHLVISY